MATSQKRGKPVKILMTDATWLRLVALSEALGQAPSTLASMAVSDYVARLTASLAMGDKAVAALVDHLGPEMKAQMDLVRNAP